MIRIQPLCALSLVAVLAGGAGSVAAQPLDSNIERLQDFKTTGTDLEIETVTQSEERAANIRRILEEINLPPGFEIDLYAIVPDARHMAVGNNVGAPRKTGVSAGTSPT